MAASCSKPLARRIDRFLTHAGQRQAAAGGQRGLSLVELLVGVAIGLFIVATGATLFTGYLRESRGLAVETRLLQDLRTAADIVARNLRRAGYWAAAESGVRSAGPGGVVANPYAAVAPDAAASDAVGFRYSRDAAENHAVDGNEQFGFRLRQGAVELQLGAGNWQALTDPETLTVTLFTVTPVVETIALDDACPSACPAGSGTCPRQSVRSLEVVVAGRATLDSSVLRSVRSSVRLRNDALSGGCPA